MSICEMCGAESQTARIDAFPGWAREVLPELPLVTGAGRDWALGLCEDCIAHTAAVGDSAREAALPLLVGAEPVEIAVNDQRRLERWLVWQMILLEICTGSEARKPSDWRRAVALRSGDERSTIAIVTVDPQVPERLGTVMAYRIALAVDGDPEPHQLTFTAVPFGSLGVVSWECDPRILGPVELGLLQLPQTEPIAWPTTPTHTVEHLDRLVIRVGKSMSSTLGVS